MNIHESVRHQMAELRWHTRSEVYAIATLRDGAVIALVVPPGGKHNDTSNPFDFEAGFVSRMQALAARKDDGSGPDWSPTTAPHLLIFAPARVTAPEPVDAA